MFMADGGRLKRVRDHTIIEHGVLKERVEPVLIHTGRGVGVKATSLRKTRNDKLTPLLWEKRNDKLIPLLWEKRNNKLTPLLWERDKE